MQDQKKGIQKRMVEFFEVLIETMQRAEAELPGKGRGQEKKKYVLLALAGLFELSEPINEILPLLIDLIISLDRKEISIHLKRCLSRCLP